MILTRTPGNSPFILFYIRVVRHGLQDQNNAEVNKFKESFKNFRFISQLIIGQSQSSQLLYLSNLFTLFREIAELRGKLFLKGRKSDLFTLFRIISITMMCIGVCSYSFALGSLTSVLTTLDSKEAKLKEKLNTLDDLRGDYEINFNTYIKLRKAIKYDNSRNEADKFQFLKELPQALNMELSVIMHQEMINKIPFFIDKSPSFISFIFPMLKPIQVLKGEYIYSEGDPFEESKIQSKIHL
jgi:hypothetical protein